MNENIGSNPDNEDEHSAEIEGEGEGRANPVVPDDFPRDPFPAALSGAQPKFSARLIDGRYVVGLTKEERIARFLMCSDLVEQLIAYVHRKQGERPEQTLASLLDQVDIGIRRKGWELGSTEYDWIMVRLRGRFLGPFADQQTDGVEP